LPLGKLSRDVGLHPATAHRILRTLQEQGYVYQTALAGPYHLGPSLMHLGRAAASEFPFREATRAEMQVLVGLCGETAYTTVLRDMEVLYVDVVESTHTVRITNHVGDRGAPHSTATGRVLLSYLPPADVSHYLEGDLRTFTPRTVTDRNELARIIDITRQQGFSVVIDEQELGVTSIAAPIMDHSGEVIAALAISGPTYRMESRMPELTALTREYASRMSFTSATRDRSVKS
jgi:DNA-binding IclR family transcriptional regulator